jgi:PDZ domain-containing secreted protein
MLSSPKSIPGDSGKGKEVIPVRHFHCNKGALTLVTVAIIKWALTDGINVFEKKGGGGFKV